jgi:hypothetical protein
MLHETCFSLTLRTTKFASNLFFYISTELHNVFVIIKDAASMEIRIRKLKIHNLQPPKDMITPRLQAGWRMRR